MKESKFGKGLNLIVAQAGKKAPSATRPEVTLVPTINRFSINSLASEEMQVESGDTVTFLVNPDAESFDEKFFITKGFGDSQATLASVGKAKGYGRTLTFNYSGIYSQMLQGTVEAKEVSPEGLVNLGLIKEGVTPNGKVSYSALKKIHFHLVKADTIELEDGEEQDVYALTDVKFVDYTPREGEPIEDGTEVAEADE